MHEDVTYYNVIDEDGTLLGGVYFDIFARKGKAGGAWQHTFITQYEQSNGIKIIPYASICANLPTPIDGISKLYLSDVETLYHESGHLIHQLFIKTKYHSLANNIAWDFIELPSQIMESWIYERETLDMITGTEDEKRIPEDLYQKMMKAKHFMEGIYLMRQLSFGKLDLEFHRTYLSSTNQSIDEFSSVNSAPRPFPRPFFFINIFTSLYFTVFN